MFIDARICWLFVLLKNYLATGSDIRQSQQHIFVHFILWRIVITTHQVGYVANLPLQYLTKGRPAHCS